MAEIKIEKKNPIWPWLLLAAVILALLYFFFTNGDDVDVDTMDDDVELVTDDVVDTNDDVMDIDDDIDDDTIDLSEVAASKIMLFSDYLADDEKMGLDHDYSHSALTKLIDATEAISNSLDVDINADLETARANANSITEDPSSLNHADRIKNAGDVIFKALKTIQVEKFPEMSTELSELQTAVMALKPGKETLEQKSNMKKFYEKAGELLTEMKNK